MGARDDGAIPRSPGRALRFGRTVAEDPHGMIPYARQSIDDADVAAVEAVLRSDFLTQGPAVERFEADLARRAGAAGAVAVANATCGLMLAYRALGVGPGSLVWTSPISFVATANAALHLGADVDFVDVDPETICLDPRDLGRRLAAAERRGRLPDVVAVVDFAGAPADLAEIAALRDRYGFRVVEDAAHAVGATYRGRPVGDGTYADATVFSFHPVKIVTTAEGGAVTAADPAVLERVALLRSHGVTRDPARMTGASEGGWYYEQVDLGWNFRLTDVQAALGASQLARLDDFLARREGFARRYDAALRALPARPLVRRDDRTSALHLYPVRVRERRRVYDALRERGVLVNVHYIPIHLQPYYRARGFAPGAFPHAEAYYAEALSLPMFAELGDDGVDRVVAALEDALAQAGAAGR